MRDVRYKKSQEDLLATDQTPPEAENSSSDRLDAFVALDYNRLMAIAATLRRTFPKTPLSTSTLVHEAWIRLARSDSLEVESAGHMKHLLVRKIRHILIDAARKADRQKHKALLVTIDARVPLPLDPAEQLIAVHDALERLERISPEQAKICEMKFFGGYTLEEIASATGLSEPTVRRRLARAQALLRTWLDDML